MNVTINNNHKIFLKKQQKIIIQKIYKSIIKYINNTYKKMKGSRASKELNQSLLNRQNIIYQQNIMSLNLLGQIRLLTKKNFILTFKNPKNVIFLIITPFLLAFVMFVFGFLTDANAQRVLQFPPDRPVPKFPQCIGKDCISLSYKFISSDNNNTLPDWITYSMQYIKKQSDIKFIQSISTKNWITTDKDLSDYYNQFNQHPNKTQIGLIYCIDKANTDNLKQFCNGNNIFQYYLVVRKINTLAILFHDILQPMPIDQIALSLKMLVDNSIYNVALNNTSTNQMNIKYHTSQYPVAKNRYIKDYDIATQMGAFYFLITPLFAFLFIQNEIVRQKQYKLRQGLNVFGASHFAYWASWFVISNVYALITSGATYGAGYAFGFGFFRQTPFYIIVFFLFYPFALAMQMLSFFLSTLSPTLKAANAICYGIVLFAIVVESFVSNNQLINFLFSDNVSTIVIILKIVLTLYPPFSYTKIYTHITQFSGFSFTIASRRWIRGNGYTLDLFVKQQSGSLLPMQGSYTRYSDLISMFILFGDALIFIILTWYFDIVIQSNRGRKVSPFFPLINFVKFIRKNKRRNKIQPLRIQQLKNINFTLQNQQQSTIKQRQRVYKNSSLKLPAFGMRIKDLSKTFYKMCSKQGVQAIKCFNLQIQPNQLMGVLGHNGAGKTTLINILTGIMSPDDTKQLQIIINNRNIERIDQIRKYIGMCSQFDILWNQMTAYQHLYMFGRLKNIPQQVIQKRITDMLKFVNLQSQKESKIQSFSGGMKRRLSLAISIIGNPKIILLDQPTTGLDPKIKQQIWQLIEKMKIGKSIILTTHSMEQADILADRICVMVKGKLKCVGTPAYLKQKYGDGHRVVLHCLDNKSGEVFRIIKKLFDKVVKIDSKGGNMIIGLNDYQNFLDLIKMFQNRQSSGLDQFNLKKLVKDWCVSHSTLEQVFMKVTRQLQPAQ